VESRPHSSCFKFLGAVSHIPAVNASADNRPGLKVASSILREKRLLERDLQTFMDMNFHSHVLRLYLHHSLALTIPTA